MLDIVGRSADTLEAVVFLLEVRKEHVRHGHGVDVLRVFGIPVHKANHGPFPPGIHHKVVGLVALGAHGRILRVPVVVAPFEVHGDRMLGSEIPGYIVCCEVLQCSHDEPPIYE